MNKAWAFLNRFFHGETRLVRENEAYFMESENLYYKYLSGNKIYFPKSNICSRAKSEHLGCIQNLYYKF